MRWKYQCKNNHLYFYLRWEITYWIKCCLKFYNWSNSWRRELVFSSSNWFTKNKNITKVEKLKKKQLGFFIKCDEFNRDKDPSKVWCKFRAYRLYTDTDYDCVKIISLIYYCVKIELNQYQYRMYAWLMNKITIKD